MIPEQLMLHSLCLNTNKYKNVTTYEYHIPCGIFDVLILYVGTFNLTFVLHTCQQKFDTLTLQIFVVSFTAFIMLLAKCLLYMVCIALCLILDNYYPGIVSTELMLFMCMSIYVHVVELKGKVMKHKTYWHVYHSHLLFTMLSLKAQE